MTSRPEFADDLNFVSGLAAVALFAVMAVVFVGAGFESATAGFPADVSVTASLGYVLMDLNGTSLAEATPGFLAAFETIDIVLVAALAGAVFLANRDNESDQGGDR